MGTTFALLRQNGRAFSVLLKKKVKTQVGCVVSSAEGTREVVKVASWQVQSGGHAEFSTCFLQYFCDSFYMKIAGHTLSVNSLLFYIIFAVQDLPGQNIPCTCKSYPWPLAHCDRISAPLLPLDTQAHSFFALRNARRRSCKYHCHVYQTRF